MNTDDSKNDEFDNEDQIDENEEKHNNFNPGNLSDSINEFTKTFSEMMLKMPEYSAMLSSFAEMSKKIVEKIDFGALYNSLSYFGDVITSAVSRIKFPTVTEERKQELLSYYRRWGEYGWTINPCEEGERLFNNEPPTTLKEADRIALKNCKDLEGLFDAIRYDKRVKKTDFDEAVADYRDHRYKSCVMILFSLIDAQLIRLQRKQEVGNSRRSAGAGAIKKAKKRVGFGENEELLWVALFYTNVFSCLETVFANGDDFKVQPRIINRNFVDHGMMTRRVSKKNCVQLFLLYYNMLEMLDLLY